MEKKIKHLEFIQEVINRMAKNSFLIKGWCITIVAALFAATNKTMDSKYTVICLFIIFIFWILDSYYLYQERLFIKHYNSIIKRDEADIDFSMDITSHKTKYSWFNAAMSHTCLVFYLSIVTITLILIGIIKI